MDHYFRHLKRPLLLCLSIIATLLPLAYAKPEIVANLTGFNKPNAAVFSPDGKSLYVANYARGSLGALRGESFISKLSVSSNGDVQPQFMEFVPNLTAPVDMAFSKVAYGEIPAGTLFVAVGTPLAEGEDGKLLKDASRELIGLLLIDPSNGIILRRINVGPASPTRLMSEKAILAPSSLAFDDQGNLYLGEMGIGGNLFKNRIYGRPGIWRIDRRGLVDLIDKVSPSDVNFMPISSLPGPMRFVPESRALYFSTNHNQGVPTGSVFMSQTDEFTGFSSMKTIVRELSSLSGMQISPRGRVILTTTEGDIIYPRGKKKATIVRFRPPVTFASPGNFAMLVMPDDSLLLAIPERSSAAGFGKGQSVKIVRLSKNY